MAPTLKDNTTRYRQNQVERRPPLDAPQSGRIHRSDPWLRVSGTGIPGTGMSWFDCDSETQSFVVFQQLIDGEAFLLLNQNDIVKILGLKLGPAIKIYNSILVIRDNAINEDVV